MRQRILLGLVILLLCAARPLGATMTPRLSLEEMVDRSELIVHGRSVRSWSGWDAAHQFIWTHHEIQIVAWIKGRTAATVVVSEPGGVADGMELSITGMPRYQPGGEMVLFLYKTPIGYWRARGLSQGKLAVVADRVRSSLDGVVLVERSGAETQTGTDLRALDGMRLGELKSRVRGLALRPATGAN